MFLDTMIDIVYRYHALISILAQYYIVVRQRNDIFVNSFNLSLFSYIL